MRALLAFLPLLCLGSCTATGNPKEGRYIRNIYIGSQLTGWVWDISTSWGQELDVVVNVGELADAQEKIHLRVTGGELRVGDQFGSELEVAQGQPIKWKVPDVDSELVLSVSLQDETREIPVSVGAPTIPGQPAGSH